MLLAAVAALLLAAESTEDAPDAGPALALQPMRLASATWSYVDLPELKGQLFADHLGKQLELCGVKVTGRSEIAALLGMERQRQLLGCSDESSNCLAELAGALGVDGLLTGTVGKTASGYVVNTKIVDANGKSLALASGRALDDDALLDWLDGAADDLSRQLAASLRRPPPPARPPRPPRARPAPPPQQVVVVQAAPSGPKWFAIPITVGVLAVVGGGALWGFAKHTEWEIRNVRVGIGTRAELDGRISAARDYEKGAWVSATLGLAALVAGCVWATKSDAPPPVSLVAGRDGAGLVFSGVLP